MMGISRRIAIKKPCLHCRRRGRQIGIRDQLLASEKVGFEPRTSGYRAPTALGAPVGIRDQPAGGRAQDDSAEMHAEILPESRSPIFL